MYTIIDNEIYGIKGNKLIKCEIKGGVLYSTKETKEIPKDLSIILTYDEIRRKFINIFNQEIIEEEIKVEVPKRTSSLKNSTSSEE